MPMYESYLEMYDSNQHHNNGADAILQVITSPCLPASTSHKL